MSCQRGNVKKTGQKYQNTFAFKHNPKSKKTKQILALPIENVCGKCQEQLEWRKRYRKYKPLTQPAICLSCHQKTITSAYHCLCKNCAKEKNVCAKCCKNEEIVKSDRQLAEEALKEQKKLEMSLEGMSERQKRAFLRKMERNPLEGDDNEKDESDDDEDDDDEDMNEQEEFTLDQECDME